MAASYPPAASRPWRPASRTLGALFAGSAMMFATAALQDGPLLAAEDEAQPVAEPLVEGTGATSAPATTTGPGGRSTPAAPSLGPGKAAPWTPGATPEWGSSLRELPVRRAPVQEAPQQGAAADSTAEDADHSGTGGADSGSQGRPAQPAEEPDSDVVKDVLDYLKLGL